MDAFVRQAFPEDIPVLAQTIREMDKKELEYASGKSPYEALEHAFAGSYKKYSVINGGSPVAMFGVGELERGSEVGSPWMLASDGLYAISRTFLRQSRLWTSALQEDFKVLVNYVYKENEKAIQWLKFCGFSFTRLIPEYGIGRKPFHEFVRFAWYV